MDAAFNCYMCYRCKQDFLDLRLLFSILSLYEILIKHAVNADLNLPSLGVIKREFLHIYVCIYIYMIFSWSPIDVMF